MAVNARIVRVRARARARCACTGVGSSTCMLDAEMSAFDMPVEPRGWRLAASGHTACAEGGVGHPMRRGAWVGRVGVGRPVSGTVGRLQCGELAAWCAHDLR